VLLVYFFWNQDTAALWASLLEIQPAWILPATIIYFVGIWLRAFRWRLLMLPFADIPTTRLAGVILIGFTVNNVLPLRLGEIVRTVCLRRSDNVPIPATLATILIERGLDMLALCGLMTLVYVAERSRMTGWVEVVSYFCATVTAAGAVGILVLVVTPFGTALAGRVHRKLGEVAASCVDGVRALEDTRSLLGVVSLSILCWIAELGCYFFLMLAVGFTSGIWSLVAGMVVANLATVLPSSPGYVGTFDVLLQHLLSDTFDVDAATAGVYTLLTHAVLLIPVVVAGLILLSREEISVRGLARGRVEERDASPLERVGPALPAQQRPDPLG
jgi:glycosyltransferase 2 family protein